MGLRSSAMQRRPCRTSFLFLGVLCSSCGLLSAQLEHLGLLTANIGSPVYFRAKAIPSSPLDVDTQAVLRDIAVDMDSRGQPRNTEVQAHGACRARDNGIIECIDT